MKMMALGAVALMGATIVASNWFAMATNAAPAQRSTAIIRVADDGRQECADNARKTCMSRCQGRSNEQSCFTDCYNEVFNMCWGG